MATIKFTPVCRKLGNVIRFRYLDGDRSMLFVNADITKENQGLIIHGCNAQYAMGAGVALAIRKRWPEAYDAYMNMEQGEGAMGKLQIVPINQQLFIGNGFTQLNLGNDGAKYADAECIRSVIKQACEFIRNYRDFNLDLKMPKIGTLRGGLDWETEVRPIYEELNTEYEDVNFIIYDIV